MSKQTAQQEEKTRVKAAKKSSQEPQPARAIKPPPEEGDGFDFGTGFEKFATHEQ